MKTNWAGNITFSAAQAVTPTTADDLRAILRGSSAVHVVGSGHSFSPIADTTGTLLSLAAMPAVFEVSGRTVRVNAGATLAELAPQLDDAGLALHTLPSLPHITIAGAVATATHGSGARSLAGAVRSVEVMRADGSVVELTSAGAVVSMGGLGVVTAVTLDVVPSFQVAQTVYEDVAWTTLLSQLDQIFDGAYSVSAFIDWQGGATLWVKHRVGDEPFRFPGHPADGPRHPVVGQPPIHCTEQGGVPGPWHARLPHFKAEFTPSVGQELQTEYFVPRTRAVTALRALAEMSTVISPLVQACEIRTISAEPQWLSPAADRDSLAIHFTWVPNTPAVLALLPRLEEAIAPRPHWGKLFTVPPTLLAARYPQWDAFKALLNEHDPKGVFRNDFLTRYFGSAASS
ncbi:FAD-binding protein [Lentzea flava]|uniref:Xylitol oxidase n=1 Tax=Lentzea flava TaxID=103732 RepID=A0ABQ2UMD7_9PSEU|nr:FAD-binding protein [Lentzea flava]MCP2201807.1 xylitol oxidase [Lentzea flava]GGU44846.1 putative xylitol oxidase [Lentzea flava]